MSKLMLELVFTTCQVEWWLGTGLARFRLSGLMLGSKFRMSWAKYEKRCLAVVMFSVLVIIKL